MYHGINVIYAADDHRRYRFFAMSFLLAIAALLFFATAVALLFSRADFAVWMQWVGLEAVAALGVAVAYKLSNSNFRYRISNPRAVRDFLHRDGFIG